MDDLTYIPEVALQADEAQTVPRPPLLVRFTHWTFTLSFFGLVVSGFAIILSHPHFYWGETGNILTQPLFSLPLPTMLGGPSGWGRSLHFQSAWLAVLSGLLYIVSGVLSKHFRRELMPAATPLVEFAPQLRARTSALQAFRAGCRRALQRSATPVLSRHRLRGLSLHNPLRIRDVAVHHFGVSVDG